MMVNMALETLILLNLLHWINWVISASDEKVVLHYSVYGFIKAFATLYHQILLKKWQYYGIKVTHLTG